MVEITVTKVTTAKNDQNFHKNGLNIYFGHYIPKPSGKDGSGRFTSTNV